MSFEINVKFMSQPNLKVGLTDDSTVSELKEKLHELTKIPAEEIKLIFKGKILKVADDKMSDLKVTADCTVHMIQNKQNTQQEPTTSEPQGQTTNNAPQTNAFPSPNQGFNGFGGLGGMGGLGGLGGMGGMGGMGGTGGMGGMGGMGMDPAMIQQMMSNPQMMTMARQLMSNPDMMRNIINNNPQLRQMTQNIPGFEEMISDPQTMQNMLSSFPTPPAQPPGSTPAQPNLFNPTLSTPQTNPQTPPNPSTPPQQLPMFGQPGQTPDLSAMLNNPLVQQYMNSMGQNAPPFPVNPNLFQPPPQTYPPNTNFEELFKDQLSHLKEMGFTNKEVNIDVLKQSNGNVEIAIEKLLNMFK